MSRFAFALLAVCLAAPAPPRVTARFSPHGGCAELVCWNVDRAKTSVFVGSYQWSSRPVHDAVLRAKARGLKVRVVLDPAGARSPLARELAAAGVAVRVDHKHALFHDKVTLRDAEDPDNAAVGTGSFNFSNAATTSNAENTIVIEGYPDVAAAYLAHLESHWAHAGPVTPGPGAADRPSRSGPPPSAPAPAPSPRPCGG